MNQVSKKLRRLEGGYAHWCPGCKEMHRVGDSWAFNGNLEKPSFAPSVKHEGYSRHHKPRVCHYILTQGLMMFYNDSTHDLAGKSVPLPDLPTDLTDA